MWSNRRFSKLLPVFAAIAFFAISIPVSGQVDTGAVRGTVTDSTGAVIPNATVTLTNTATGLVSTTTTSESGTYTFTPVRIGPYDITVKSSGFRDATSHITVSVQDQIRADFKMTPGAASEKVEVTATAPQLQTQDASVGAVVGTTQVNNLPLNGRNYTFLAQTNAGVVGIKSERGMDATGSFVANGLPTVHNNYLLDGIDNNNDTVDFLNGAAYVNLPPPDAIQEFKVQTSNFSAEFGRAGGAVVNATIKSGTNKLHGSAWEFLRNPKLDAMPLDQYFNDPKNKKKASLKQNQFGGSIGGPIRKNKTFFFGDYEGIRIRQGLNMTNSVPTATAVSSGYTDFRDLLTSNAGQSAQTDLLGRTFNPYTIFDPATTRPITAGTVDPVTGLMPKATGYVRDPFYAQGSVAGITNFTTLTQYLNQLPANRLNPNVIKLLKLYPAANATPTSGVQGNYQQVVGKQADTNHFDVRMDQVFSDRDQLFGRASFSRQSGFYPAVFPQDVQTDSYWFGTGNVTNNSYNYAISETHMFSSRLINEFRAGWSYLYTNIAPPDSNVMGIPAQYGIQGIPQVAYNGGLPNINITGLTFMGAQGWASPNWRKSKTLQLSDNVTRIVGSHSLKTGFEFQDISFPYFDPPASRGQFNYNGTYTGAPQTWVNGSVSGMTSNVGVADLLLTPIASTVSGGINYVGGPSGIWATSINLPRDTRKYVGAYFQDDWKLNQKLTLNLGLRWEYFSQVGELNGMQAALISNDNGMHATYDILSSQKNVALSPSFTALMAKDGIPIRYVDQVLNVPKNSFAPRVGLAYQLSSKLVARLGYGIFFGGFENVGGSPDPGANYPFAGSFNWDPITSGVTPITYTNGATANFETGFSQASPDPASPNFKANGLGPQAFASNWKTAYTQQWNVSAQYQMTPTQSVTVAYIGNNSIHSVNGASMNTPAVLLPAGTALTSYLQFPDLGRNMNYLVPNGRAYYQSVQFTYERRLSKGLSVLANYTRSVCKTDARNILGFGDSSWASAYQLSGWDPLKNSYAYCGNDVPNLFHASGMWELPIGKGKLLATNSGVLNALIGGWSTQWNFTAENGFPGNIGCATTPTAGLRSCYAPVASGKSVYADSGPNWSHTFLNAAAFTNPPAVTSIGQTDFSPVGGTAGQFHGPTFQQLDFSIFKRFRTTESTNLELRSEFFNMFNHPNFGNSFKSGNYTNPNFGVINGTRGSGRQIQVALKLYF